MENQQHEARGCGRPKNKLERDRGGLQAGCCSCTSQIHLDRDNALGILRGLHMAGRRAVSQGASEAQELQLNVGARCMW